MNSQKIEKILEKYFHGDTSLTEERTLREFFCQEELPAHLAELKDQFMMFEEAAEEVLPDDFDDSVLDAINEKERISRASKRSVIYYISGVAATILILVTVFFRFQPFVGGSTYSDEEADQAFQKASRIFGLVSDKVNKSTVPLEKVARFDEGMDNLKTVNKFDEGVKKSTPISRFKQITDLITNPAP